MKKSFCLVCFFLLINFCYGQNPVWEWAHTTGGDSFDYGRSVVTDLNDNFYVFGTIRQTSSQSDFFLRKFDKDRNTVWTKSWGGPSWEYARAMAIDNSGNLYLTGGFSQTVDFDPGPSIAQLSSSGFSDVFVLKLNSDGEYLWARSFSGPSDNDFGSSIAVDASQNVYLTGFFYDTVDFDPGSGISQLISNGVSDIFILKLNQNGIHQWSKSFGGIEGDGVNSIALDSNGNIFLTGYFYETVDFNPGLEINNYSSQGSYDYFVTKFDNNGDFVWAEAIGTSSGDGGSSLAIDQANNVYVAGYLGNGRTSSFLRKYQNSGNLLWESSMEGTGTSVCNSLALSNDSNFIYLTGYLQGTFDFDPGSEINNHTSNGSNDVFIQCLNNSGDFVWAESFGGDGSDVPISIINDASEKIYLTGFFSSTVDFNPCVGNANITSRGNTDVFVTLFSQTDGILNVAENNSLEKVLLYPNPSKDKVIINLGGLSEVSAKIYTVGGDLIYEKRNISQSLFEVDVKLNPGLYFVNIVDDNQSKVLRLIRK